MYDFRNETLPFTTKDADGDDITIVALTPDGEKGIGYYKSDYSGKYNAIDVFVSDNSLQRPVLASDAVIRWLTDNSHFLDAVHAFVDSGKKILGIKFIRATVPVWVAPNDNNSHIGLVVAKEAFEKIADVWGTAKAFQF